MVENKISEKPLGRDESSTPSRSSMADPKRRVIVKFRDSIDLPYEDEVERYLGKVDDEFWPILFKRFPGITIQRLFRSLSAPRILDLTARARKIDRTYDPPNFLTYFAVPIPNGIDARALAKAFSSRQAIVERAYVEGVPTTDPSAQNNPLYEVVDPTKAEWTYWPGQRYLRGEADIDAPNGVKIKVSGIDAEYAWTVSGGDGGGATADLQFVDLEQGWFLDHQDLPPGKIILDGSNQYLEHGTSVLGVVFAQDNTFGCIGITPNVATVRAVSWHRPTPNIPDAIQAALAVMNFGDVLLLEVQINYGPYNMVPLEIDPVLFDLIRLGTALGIIIVEAAGNGNLNLDGIPYMPTDDSGAIMVGAAGMTVPHFRPPYSNFSNYGDRINCYAWGENIVTLGNRPNSYTYGFGATSGASAIVAGAALSVQGISILNNGFRLSPQQMRTLLRDPALGTQSQNPAVDKVGVMPNLKNIIPAVLALTPDIYIRDNETDTGAPHTGPICESPDIILRPSMITLPDTPQDKYGEGSGTESDKTLGFEAEAGQDNFIYVRMRNKGKADATNVMATVYWSPVATLVTPNLWTEVGSTVLPNVPANNHLYVSDAITWPSAEIPATGHYCFVALIDTAADPSIPNPQGLDFLNDWNNFFRFIRENNNVTWRNFNVVDNTPTALHAFSKYPFVELPFLMTGPHDGARNMRFEILGKLPSGSKLILKMSTHQREFLEHFGSVQTDEDQKMGRVQVDSKGVLGTKLISLPENFKAEARLLVHIPEESRRRFHDVYIRQFYEGQEVGRITWRLAPVRRPTFPHT